MLSCEAVGGKAEDVLEAAAGIELLHTFTLIHDDIMDHDEFRRNVKTVHVLWGEPMAIIAGDSLFAKVFEALSANVRRLGLNGAKAAEVFGLVSRASFEVCRGQAMDMLLAQSEEVSEAQYLEMIAGKTGALMEASTKVGAILGGGTPEQVRALGNYGRLIGMAFQIRDDVLGVLGESKKFGKPLKSDIREGKKTLIVIYALESLGAKDRKTLVEVLGKRDASEREVTGAVKLLKRSGAIDRASERAEAMVLRAKRCLRGIPGSNAKQALIRIADFVINREF
jgi:geranylgeranyl diphosphate synthase type I